jgi:multiple sugar transport system permease protein
MKKPFFGYWAIALFPPLVYLFVWRIIPLFYTIWLSFHAWNLIKDAAPTFANVKNYVELVQDIRFFNALGRTLFLMCGAVLGELILGLILAVLLDRDLKGKSIFRGIFLLPMIITPVVVGVTWYILYNPKIGPLSYFLELLSFPAISWLGDPAVVLYSIMLADIWQWTPFMFLLLLAALQTIPDELYEAAKVDGASAWHIFKEITLPLLKPTLMIAVLLRSMDAFRIFPKVFVMTGGGPGQSTEVSSILIYKTAFSFYRIGYAASMVIVALGIVAGMYAVYLKLSRQFEGESA